MATVVGFVIVLIAALACFIIISAASDSDTVQEAMGVPAPPEPKQQA